MFLTIESARLPCCTTLSRLPCNISVISLTWACSLSPSLAPASASRNSSISSTEMAEKLLTKLSGFLISCAMLGCQLAERGELLGLHQAILRGPQVLQRLRQFTRAGLNTLEQPHILYRDDRLIGEGGD